MSADAAAALGRKPAREPQPTASSAATATATNAARAVRMSHCASAGPGVRPHRRARGETVPAMPLHRALVFTPAVELSKLYRARKVSPLEVMQAVLARIDTVNPAVNAIVTLTREAALREARRATAALRRSSTLPPLFGVPVGIKDVTQTKGIRTTFGSKLFEGHVPDEDALVVQRLRNAGAIVIGKTNTPEFAFGPNTEKSVLGATH